MISFKEDQFINDNKEHTTRWVAKLNDGRDVYYDDYRPGLDDHSSWSRLKKYCEDNSLHIREIYLQFRSHYETMPSDKEGYFFSKVARGYIKGNKTEQYYLIGYLEKETVYIKKYSVPALVLREEFTRSKEECKDCLIWQRNE